MTGLRGTDPGEQDEQALAMARAEGAKHSEEVGGVVRLLCAALDRSEPKGTPARVDVG